MTTRTLIAVALMTVGVLEMVATALLAAVCRCRRAGTGLRWPCRFARTERGAIRWILFSLMASAVLVSAGVATATYG